jgi:predicted ester cyclase
MLLLYSMTVGSAVNLWMMIGLPEDELGDIIKMCEDSVCCAKLKDPGDLHLNFSDFPIYDSVRHVNDFPANNFFCTFQALSHFRIIISHPKNLHIMKPLFIIATAIACLALACNSNSSSTSKADTTASATTVPKPDPAEKNKQTALAAQEGFNSHNADLVFKDAAIDIIDYGNGSGSAIKGKDSCKAFVQALLVSFPDMKGENFMAIADGNHVAVFGDWSGTFKKGMMGMKPTNKSFKMKDVDLFTFNDDGKITEHRSIQSNEYMMMQLGVKMKK